jgi:hypothetical protein
MSCLKCPHCGLTNFATADRCKRCDRPLRLAQEEPLDIVQAHNSPTAKPTPESPIFIKQENMMTKSQGYILIGVLIVGFALLTWSIFKPQTKYEYKITSFLTESNDRTGEGAMKFATVKLDEGQIALMGREGWELVGTFLEMETAYPNFGNSEYVTGLQPNIRPQRAILIFKRQIR